MIATHGEILDMDKRLNIGSLYRIDIAGGKGSSCRTECVVADSNNQVALQRYSAILSAAGANQPQPSENLLR
jgi:hypothetical protein